MLVVLVSNDHKVYKLFKNVWVIIQDMYREKDIGQKRGLGWFSMFKVWQ